MLNLVFFCDKATAERNAALPDWAVISIGDPCYTANLQEGWLDVLYLGFLDTEDRDDAFSFSELDAVVIADFVEDVEERSASTILVHCNSGTSRSAAVAKWIARYYDLPFNHLYAHHNKLVYLTLHEYGQILTISAFAAGSLSEEKVMRRLGLSHAELQKALQDDSQRADSLAAQRSELSCRIAKIKRLAEEVFGGPTLARRWLTRYNPILGNVPLCELRTESGEKEVLRILESISRGGVV